MDEQTWQVLETRVRNKLVARLQLEQDSAGGAYREERERVQVVFDNILGEEQGLLDRETRKRLWAAVTAHVGLGPLEELLAMPDVVEILVNGPKQIYIARAGVVELERAAVEFRDADHLMRIITKILAPVGRYPDESHPILDARLADGTRVHVVIPPIALDGPLLVLRKTHNTLLALQELLAQESLPAVQADFLRACVAARWNILVAGGTGAGKSTLLNVVGGMIPAGERVLLLERVAELILPQAQVVRLEARPPNIEGRGAVTMRDLVQSAVRMRPDRLVLGDVSGDEAWDFVQAINTGNDGALTSIMASGPQDALSRLELLITTANPMLSLLAVREQMATAIDLIVQVERLRDGRRKVTRITEVAGLESAVVVTHDVFEFRRTGYADGHVEGHFTATGRVPQGLARLRETGAALPVEVFTPTE